MGYVKCDDIFFVLRLNMDVYPDFPSYCCLPTSLYCLDHFSVFVFCLSLVFTTKKHFESAHLVHDGWLSLTLQHLNTLLDTGVIKLVGGEVMFEGFLPKKSPLFGLVIYHDPCIMRTNKNLRTVRVYLPGHWWDDPGRKGKLVNGGMMFFFLKASFSFQQILVLFWEGVFGSVSNLYNWDGLGWKSWYVVGMGGWSVIPHSSLVTLKTVRMENIRFWYQWPKFQNSCWVHMSKYCFGYGYLSILEGLFVQPRQGFQIPISLCYRGCSTPMVLLCVEYLPSGNIITEKSLFSTWDNKCIFNLFCFDVLIAMFTGSRPAVSYSPGSIEDLTRQQVSCVPVSSSCFWEIVEQRYFEKNGTKPAAQKMLQNYPF